MMYSVAVGAEHNALLDFFHSPLKRSVFKQFVDRFFFGATVHMVEIKRSWVVLPTLYAG
jgi:hypothetical protein